MPHTQPVLTTAKRHAEKSAEFSLLVMLLLPGCLAMELVRPGGKGSEAEKTGFMGAALDRARSSAATAFTLPG